MKNIYTSLLFLFLTNAIIAQCFEKIQIRGYTFVTKKTDNSFWIWGENAFGQLGNGNPDDTDEYLPAQIITNGTIMDIYCGQLSTYFIKQNGSLWGTGTNYNGALGIGSSVLYSNVFVHIGTATNWKTVAPGSSFTIALKNNNTLWAWGSNQFNQVGNGSNNNVSTPVQISNDTDWKTIKTGLWPFSFALKNNGTLWCWGDNIANVLNGNNINRVEVPTQHNPDSDWADFACGDAHTLAIKTNGTLWAWGNYGFGETGIDINNVPNPYNNGIPRQIGTDTNWSTVAAGLRFSMGIKTNGTLWVWGINDEGQLGDGGTTNRFVPFQIGTDSNWASVSCGIYSTGALKTDGTFWVWGKNFSGEFGNGTLDSSNVPILVQVDGCTLSTNQFSSQENRITIAPNPAKDYVEISYNNLPINTAFAMYDLTGRLLENYYTTDKNGNWTINTTKYPKGIYLIVAKENNQVVSQQKLIIE